MRVWSDFGARRFAFNWALAQVKVGLDAKKLDPAHESVLWDLYAFRRRFNAEEATVASWWQESSKEVYLTGIADLCTAFENWKGSIGGEEGPEGRLLEVLIEEEGPGQGAFHHWGRLGRARPADRHLAGCGDTVLEGEHPTSETPGPSRQGPHLLGHLVRAVRSVLHPRVAG